MTRARKLYNQIERLRQELHELLIQNSANLTTNLIIEKSHELDICIHEYQELQLQPSIE